MISSLYLNCNELNQQIHATIKFGGQKKNS